MRSNFIIICGEWNLILGKCKRTWEVLFFVLIFWIPSCHTKKNKKSSIFSQNIIFFGNPTCICPTAGKRPAHFKSTSLYFWWHCKSQFDCFNKGNIYPKYVARKMSQLQLASTHSSKQFLKWNVHNNLVIPQHVQFQTGRLHPQWRKTRLVCTKPRNSDNKYFAFEFRSIKRSLVTGSMFVFAVLWISICCIWFSL